MSATQQSSFDNWKKTFLAKEDKSKKGSIDKEILPMINTINAHPGYFTTSSCAGRIYLWKEPGNGKKKDVEWLFMKHGAIKKSEITKALKNISKEIIWLRIEPFIMHVCCRNIGAANRLLTTAQRVHKKSHFLSLKNKIIIEIIGSEFIDVPIAEGGKLLISDDYLNFLVKKVNKKYGEIGMKNRKFKVRLGLS